MVGGKMLDNLEDTRHIYVGTPEAQRLHDFFEVTKDVIKRGERLAVTFNKSKLLEYKFRGTVSIRGINIEIIHTDTMPPPEDGYAPDRTPSFGETWEVEVVTNWGWEQKQYALVRPIKQIS